MKIEKSKHPNYLYIVIYLLEHDTYKNLAKFLSFLKYGDKKLKKKKKKIF